MPNEFTDEFFKNLLTASCAAAVIPVAYPETDLTALFAEIEAEKLADPAGYEARINPPAPPAPVDSKGRPFARCGKCFGTGYIQAFYYIANGCCFDCGGSGCSSGRY